MKQIFLLISNCFGLVLALGLIITGALFQAWLTLTFGVLALVVGTIGIFLLVIKVTEQIEGKNPFQTQNVGPQFMVTHQPTLQPMTTAAPATPQRETTPVSEPFVTPTGTATTTSNMSSVIIEARETAEEVFSELEMIDSIHQTYGDKGLKTLVLSNFRGHQHEKKLGDVLQGKCPLSDVLCKGIYKNLDMIPNAVFNFNSQRIEFNTFLAEVKDEYEQVIIVVPKALETVWASVMDQQGSAVTETVEDVTTLHSH